MPEPSPTLPSDMSLHELRGALAGWGIDARHYEIHETAKQYHIGNSLCEHSGYEAYQADCGHLALRGRDGDKYTSCGRYECRAFETIREQ